MILVDCFFMDLLTTARFRKHAMVNHDKTAVLLSGIVKNGPEKLNIKG